MGHEQNDEGFTLLELMVAVSIAVVVLATATAVIHVLITALNHPLAMIDREIAFHRLEMQLRSDAQTALILPPANQVNGVADELQLGGMDLEHNWHQWSYRIGHGFMRTTDAGQSVLDRGVTGMHVHFTPIDQLSASGELAAPFFAHVAYPQRQSVTLGGKVISTGIAEVDIIRGSWHRRLHLASALIPTGFAIEHGPQWHAVLSRSASTSRRFFGLAQKTKYTVYGNVTYSLDHWRTSYLWCQYVIYGNRDNGDPVVEMHIPNVDPNESSIAIFRACQKTKHAHELPVTPADQALQSAVGVH